MNDALTKRLKEALWAMRDAKLATHHRQAVNDALRVLYAIEAMPDQYGEEPFDGYDDFVHGKNLGYEIAIRSVKHLFSTSEVNDD